MSHPKAKQLREHFDWGESTSDDVAMQGADVIDQQAALIRELVGALKKNYDAWLSNPEFGPQKEIKGDRTVYRLNGETVGNALVATRVALSRVPEEYRGQ